jgi:Protein of unknown function (DUF2783)
MNLNVNTNIAKPDDFYAAWLAAHEGLPEAKSHDLNAALVLLLANHIGDASVLEQALQLARNAIDGAPHAQHN